jgi:hypothetical protein
MPGTIIDLFASPNIADMSKLVGRDPYATQVISILNRWFPGYDSAVLSQGLALYNQAAQYAQRVRLGIDTGPLGSVEAPPWPTGGESYRYYTAIDVTRPGAAGPETTPFVVVSDVPLSAAEIESRMVGQLWRMAEAEVAGSDRQREFVQSRVNFNITGAWGRA